MDQAIAHDSPLEVIAPAVKRLSRKWMLLAAALVALVAAGGAVWMWWSHRAPIAYVSDVKVIDASTSAVLWASDSHGWLSRIDAAGNTVWWRRLPGAPLDGDALQVGDGVIAVRYAHRTAAAPEGCDQAIVAFSLDGKQLWDKVLTPFNSKQGSKPFLDGAMPGTFAGDHLVELANDGNRTMIYSIQPATGAVTWSEEPDQNVHVELSARLVMGSRVLLYNPMGLRVVDAAARTERQQGVNAAGCVVGDEFVTLDRGYAAALVAYKGGDLDARRVIREPFRPVGDPARSDLDLVSCGHYRDRLVFSIRKTDRDAEERDRLTDYETRFLVITDLTGAVLHTLELRREASFLVTRRYPDHATVGGELTRFVPYLYQDDVSTGLVILDLDDGTIAWRSAKELDGGGSLFRAGDRWYLTSDDTVSVFDGTTGHLDGAIHSSYLGSDQPDPLQVAGGRVWLHGRDRGRIDDPPVAVLDARTLAPLHVHGMAIADVTVPMRAELGLH